MLKTIDFPNKTRVISYTELTPEQIKMAEELLILGKEFHEKERQLHLALPEGYYAGFYGNWDLMLIQERGHGPED